MCFSEDIVTAPRNRGVLGYVESRHKNLYKIQLCIQCLSREIHLFRGEDVRSKNQLPTGCWSVCPDFSIVMFSWKEKWTNKYDTYCYLKYSYDLFFYNREVVFGVTLSFISNDRFRFTVLQQNVVFLPVVWFPQHARQKQSCSVLRNVTDGVNGQFIDWEIDFSKIQIVQKFSLQVLSWFPFSIEK